MKHSVDYFVGRHWPDVFVRTTVTISIIFSVQNVHIFLARKLSVDRTLVTHSTPRSTTTTLALRRLIVRSFVKIVQRKLFHPFPRGNSVISFCSPYPLIRYNFLLNAWSSSVKTISEAFHNFYGTMHSAKHGIATVSRPSVSLSVTLKYRGDRLD